MVYKRYIKKNGRIYGPYVYHNKKKDGKVISTYLGKSVKVPRNDSLNKNLLKKSFMFLFILAFALFFVGHINNLTGNVSISIDESYELGDSISGSVKLILKEGEFLSKETIFKINNVGEEKEYGLEELVDLDLLEGDFYVENKLINGSGEGYGVAGEKETYPEVEFVFRLYDLIEESSVGSSETTEEASVEDSSDSELEDVSEDLVEEEVSDEIEIIEEIETESEEEIEPETTTEIVSSVVEQEFEEFGGVVKFGESVAWDFIGEKEVEIISSDEEVNFEIKDNQVIFTTDYVEMESGFGEDFLGDEELEIVINFSKLNLTAREGTLNLALDYFGEEIVSNSVLISVEGYQEKLAEDAIGIVLNNQTVINESILNETLFNETLNESFLNVTLETIQYSVVVGKPVKWKKIIVANSSEVLEVEIPKGAENIEVFEVIEGEDFNETISEGLEIDSSGEIISISGKVSLDIELGEESSIGNFFKNLFNSFTGQVISIEEGENKTVVIDENATTFEIVYETPGPISYERDLESGKEIIVSDPNEFGYENILAFTYFEEQVYRNSINLYHLEEGVKRRTEFVSYDLDNNSLVDYIEWIVPHLSNQTYEIELTILNVQSYPIVGKNWTVQFNTSGTADLRITPINGTTWGTTSTENDLMFLQVRCGDEIFSTHWENETIVASNYSCDGTGYESSRVRTAGGHYLEFDFGGIKAYARNSAVCGDIIYGDTTLDGDLVACTGHGILLGYNSGDYTLDCAGYTIDGTMAAGKWGIFFQNAHNVTIKNCVVKQFERGMHTYNPATNLKIINNTVHSSLNYNLFISASGSNGNLIYNNTFYNTSAARGVYLASGNNLNFSNNIVYDSRQSGVYLSVFSDSSVVNNKIYNNTDYGLRLGSSNNITVDSNDIYLNEDENILMQGTSDSLIKNNILRQSTTDSGIFLSGSTNERNNITNNTVYGNYDYGIAAGAWTTFTGNNTLIDSNDIYHNLRYGIFFVAQNSTIFNNKVHDNNGSIEVYFYTGSNYNNVSNNEIYGSPSSGLYARNNHNNFIDSNNIHDNSGVGFILYGVNYTTFSNNNVSDNWKSSSYGGNAMFGANSNYNVFDSNNFIGGGDFGLRITTYFNHNVFRNNIIANSTDNLALLGDTTFPSINNSFYADTFSQLVSSNQGVYIYDFYNTTFVSSSFGGLGWDIASTNTYGNYTTAINSTWDQLAISSAHEFTKKEFLEVNVNTSNGDLSGAKVEAYDNVDNLEFSGFTNSIGDVKTNLTDYVLFNGAYTYFNNYTLNTTSPFSTYGNDSREINVTSTVQEYITLNDVGVFESTLCSDGKCFFNSTYILAEVGYSDAVNIVYDAGFFHKWNISDFCNLDLSADNVYLQFNVSRILGSPDNDATVNYIRNQSMSESSTAIQLHGMAQYNSTTYSNWFSNTGGGLSNVSITKFVNEACDRDEYLTIKAYDADYSAIPVGIKFSASSFFNFGHVESKAYVTRELSTTISPTGADPELYIFYTEPTKIQIQSPSNSSYSVSNGSTIWFNATSSETIDSWKVNYNGTNVTISINSSLEVENGNHHLFLYGNDSSTGEWYLNDEIYFTVDTTLPAIEVRSPWNYNYSTNSILFDADATEEISSWIANYNGTNFTFVPGNYYSVSDGNYNLKVYASDSGGNTVLSDFISFGVDSSEIDFTLLSPLNNSKFTTNDVDLNWTADKTLSFCSYDLDDSINSTNLCKRKNTYLDTLVSGYFVAANGLQILGDYAYIVSYTNNSLTIVNISAPSEISIVGAISGVSLDGPNTIEVEGNYAYITTGDTSNLVIVDISDVENPFVASSFSHSSIFIPFGLAYENDVAYVSSIIGNKITAVDVSNRSNPVYLDDLTDSSFNIILGIFASSGYLYAGSSNGASMTIIDALQKDNLSIVSTIYNSTNFGAINSPFKRGNYLYTLATSKVNIINVSNKSSPEIVSTLTLPCSSQQDLVVFENSLYVSCGTGDAIVEVDISNVSNPVIVEVLSSTDLDANYLSFSDGKLAFGTYSENTFGLLDVGMENSNYTFSGLSEGNHELSLGAIDQVGNSYDSGQNTFLVDTIVPTIDFVSPTITDGEKINSAITLVNVTTTDPNDLTSLINLDESLIAWYRLNENSMQEVVDSSGYSNNGFLGETSASTSEDPSWSSGRFGSGLEFDGIDDFVYINDSDELDLGYNYSIAFWIKFNGFENGNQEEPFSKEYYLAESINAGYYVYKNGISSDFSFIVHNGTNQKYGSLNWDIPDKQWAHVAFTFNGTTVLMYKNGVYENSFLTEGYILPWTSNLILGSNAIHSANYFNGSLDELQFWNRSLSLEEIKASYDSGANRLETNFTSLVEGNHSIRAYVQDEAGQVNSTEERTFEIDFVTPTINVFSPENISYSKTGISLDVYSAESIETWYWNIDGEANNTFTPNVSLGVLGDGLHQLFVYAKDYADNWGVNDSIYFFQDSLAPNVTWEIPTPENDEVIDSNFVYLNTTIEDSLDSSAFFDWNNSVAGYWNFEYSNSTGIYGNSSYSNFAKFGGGLSQSNISSGVYGDALDFDGVDDYLEIEDTEQLRLGENYSITFWVKFNNLMGASQILFSKLDTYGYYLDKVASSNEIYFISLDIDQDFELQPFLYTASDGEWSHVAIAVEDNFISIYNDGILKTSFEATGPLAGDPINLIIGANSAHNNNFFNGSFDEFTIHNRALTPEEVNASYNNSQYFLYSNFTNLDLGNYTYSAYAIDETGNFNISSRDVSYFISPPVINEVAFLESPLYTKDLVSCKYNITSQESAVANMSFYIDGVLIQENNSVAVTSGEIGLYNLSSNFTHHGENVTCSVISESVGGVSTRVNASIIISNYSTSLSLSDNVENASIDEDVSFYANFSSSLFGDVGSFVYDTGNLGDDVEAVEFFDCQGSGKMNCLVLGKVTSNNEINIYNITEGLVSQFDQSGVHEMVAFDANGDGYKNEFVTSIYSCSVL